MQKLEDHSRLWKLIGKAIVQDPERISRLLNKHGLILKKQKDPKELTDGIIGGLGRNNTTFNRELTALLSVFEKEDQFINAIAAAVGSVAGAIGSGQQKKAAREQARAQKEQARAQTLSSVLAYKAQQDASRMEELKLRQQHGAKSKQGVDPKTLTIIVGIMVALIIMGVVYYQRNHPTRTIIQPITQPNRK